ncbi:MAG: phospholipid carrier-dependent glycosyltransferase [Symploca sp. SIO3C6]|nr:phospholipid carrier-dependent glycosyltransferase [Symploca sp. SIO3C6]
MALHSKLHNSSIFWFRIGMTTIFIISFALRFWGLSRFNSLVFDEVYYAKFANNYLTNTPFFNAHPPLSQYTIAIGIKIGSHLPFGQDTVNSLTGSVRSTWSYRWLNALTGSLIPLVVGALAYQLNRRRSYALIAALLAATDGLFLVESRYALNNIYIVIFGLLAQLFLLMALNKPRQQRQGIMALSGVLFGACAATKWNGLGFLLGVYLVWAAVWIMHWVRKFLEILDVAPTQKGEQEEEKKGRRGEGERGRGGDFVGVKPSQAVISQTPLQKFRELNVFHILGNFAIIPILTYSLLWIPHLQMNPTPGFWQMQKEIFNYHQNIGSGSEVHPYCSRWYSWPLMLRTIAYFHHAPNHNSEANSLESPVTDGVAEAIYDVHAMGNPVLWWLSTAAILLLLVVLVLRFKSSRSWKLAPTRSTLVALYLVLNWLGNLLPWSQVSRCLFLYHYMCASVFASLGLAWVLDWLIQNNYKEHQGVAVSLILLILIAFCFWMPIYLGLPLSVEGYQWRMWLPSWI